MKRIRNKSILLIDDDAGLLRALGKVLSGEGAIVTTTDWAGDGIELLSKRDQHFDLVITDLQMPFVNGLTVVRALHEIFPALPVVVLTAFAEPEAKAACLEQGAVAFLEKPLGSQELIAAVQEALRAKTPTRRSSPSAADRSQRVTHPSTSQARASSSSAAKI